MWRCYRKQQNRWTVSLGAVAFLQSKQLLCEWTQKHLSTDWQIIVKIYYNRFGGSPVVVFHSSPGGTSQSPLQSQSQSVFLIFSRIASTNVSTGHMPSFCSGQPLIPVKGATPSLIMMRIWGPGKDVHSRTRTVQNQRGRWERDSDSRWNCTFAAKGESSDVRNLRSLGMCVYGNGPCSAKLVKSSAVMT